MKKFTRKITVCLVFIMSAFILAGCSSANKTTGGNTSSNGDYSDLKVALLYR